MTTCTTNCGYRRCIAMISFFKRLTAEPFSCCVVSPTIISNRGKAPATVFVRGKVKRHAGHSGALDWIGVWQYGQRVTVLN